MTSSFLLYHIFVVYTMILNFDKKTGEFSSGITTLVKSIGSIFKKNLGTTLSSELSDAFKSQKLDTNMLVGDFIKTDTFSGLSAGLQDYINKIPEGERATKKMSEVIGNLGEQGKKAQDGLSKLGQIGLNIVSSVGNMLISMAVSKVIEIGLNKLNEMIHAQEIAIEKGKEAQQEIQDIEKSYSEAEATTETAGKRYNELRGGVRMDGNKIDNVSLSTEEFQEFLSINQQLAALYPELISGVDSQGNKLVDLGTDAETATEALQHYLDVQREIANQKIASNIPALTDGIIAQNDSLAEQNRLLQIDADKQQDIIQDASKLSYGALGIDSVNNLDFGLDKINLSSADYSGYDAYVENIERITKALDEAGIAYQNHVTDWGPDVNGNPLLNNTIELFDATDSQMQLFRQKLSEQSTEMAHFASDELNKDLSQIAINKRQMEDNWRTAIPSFQAALKTSKAFQEISGISDVIGEQILNSMNNIDFLRLKPEQQANMLDYIRAEFVYPIQDALNNAKDKDAMQKSLEQLLTLDYGDLTNSEMSSQIDSLVEQLFPNDVQKQIEFKVAIGYEYYDEETGKYVPHIRDLQEKIYQNLGNEIDENGKFHRGDNVKIGLEEVGKLTQDQMATIGDAIDTGTFDFDATKGSFEDLIQWIENKQNELKNVTKEATGTLQDLFNDEGYQTNSAKYKEDISTLNTALESMRENGHLTAEEMTNLQESFPDLTDFSEEAISSKAFENLKKWIEEIKSGMDDMSPEGIEQANTYIENLIASMGVLGAKTSEVKDLFLDLNVEDKHAGSHDRHMAGEEYDQRVAELEANLAAEGQEINMNVVAALVATDQFSGTADEILAKYKDMEVPFKIVAENEAVEKLEKEIEGRNSSISKERSNIELKNARGDALKKSDYSNIISQQLGIINDRKTQREIQERTLSMMRTAIGNGSTHYTQADLEAQEQRVNEAISAENDARVQLIQDQTDSMEAGNSYYNKLANQNKSAADKLSAEMQENQKAGVANSRETYNQLQSLYKAQADSLRNSINYYDQEALNKDYDPAVQQVAREQAASLRSELAQVLQDIDSSGDNGYFGEQLDNMNSKLQTYKDAASEIQQSMELAEKEGLKPQVKDYEDLIDNAKKQMKLLESENDTLEEQKKANKGNREELDRIESQIRSNNSAISDLKGSTIDWSNAISNLPITNIDNLSSALQQAMSEINSTTGLTGDTIQQLQTQFSDLGVDISDALYRTENGMKANVNQLETLSRAAADKQFAQFRQEIEAQRKAVEEARAAYEASGDSSALDAEQAKLDSLLQKQAEYFAKFQEQQKMFSDYQAIQNAKQTANAGDEYVGFKSELEAAKQAYDTGLVGTDDFKSVARYMDPYGRTDPENFIKNYERYNKYWSDDSSGPKAFLKDLESQGLATYETLEDGSKRWTWSIDDSKKAAAQMGMSLEAFNAMFGRMQDFGFFDSLVTSAEQGELKTEDLANQIVQAKSELAEMEAMGYPEEAIQNKREEIEDLERNLGDLNSEIATFNRNEIQNAEKSLTAERKRYDTVKGWRDELYNKDNKTAADYHMLEGFENELKSIAQENGFEIDSKFNIDEEDYERQIQNARDKAEAAGFGSIDKPIDVSKLNLDEASAAYQNFEDNVSLVQNAVKNGTADIQDEIDKLNGISVDSLNDIDFNDHQFSAGEAALESMAEKLGIGKERAEELIPALEALGLIDIGTDSAADIEAIGESAEDATKSVKKLDKNGNVAIDVVTNADLASKSIKELQEEAEEIRGSTAGMGQADRQESEQIASMYEDMADRKMTIHTEIEGAADSKAKLQELKGMTDEELAAHWHVDVDSDEFEGMKTELDSIKDSDIPMKVQIAEESLTALTDAIKPPEEPMPVKADTSEANSAITEVQNKAKEPQTMTINANNHQAIQAVAAVVNMANSAHPIITVGANTSDATGAVDALIADINGRTANINVTVNESSGGPSVSSGITSSTRNSRPGWNAFRNKKEVQTSTSIENQVLNVEANTSQAEQAIADLNSTELPDKSLNISADGAYSVISSLKQETSQIEINPEPITIEANTESATSGIDSVSTAMDNVDSDKTVTINDETDTARNNLQDVKTKIDNIDTFKQTTIQAVTAQAAEALGSIKALLNSIQSKTVTVTVNKVDNTGGSTTSPATGTMSSIAHASGTAYNVYNYKSPSPAHAGGSVALPHDELALTSEVGTESIVRNGKWMLLPGGAHFENLKKGDIVFNHKQTSDLLRDGRTPGHGKIVGGPSAFAQGTVRNVPALAGGTFKIKEEDIVEAVAKYVAKRTGGGDWAGGAAEPSGNNPSSGGNNGGGGNGGGNSGGGSGSGSGSSNKPEEPETYDWVERVLQKWERAVQKIADTITDYVSAAFKVTQLKKQIATIEGQIQANEEAARTYRNKLSSIGLRQDYIDKIKGGVYSIEDIAGGDATEALRKQIEKYQEYYDKLQDCEAAVQELRNSQLDLFNDQVRAPLEEYANEVDRLSSSLDKLESRMSSASGGGSFLNAYADVLKSDQKVIEKLYLGTKENNYKDGLRYLMGGGQKEKALMQAKYDNSTGTASGAGRNALSKINNTEIREALKYERAIDLNAFESTGGVLTATIKTQVQKWNDAIAALEPLRSTPIYQEYRALTDAEKYSDRANQQAIRDINKISALKNNSEIQSAIDNRRKIDKNAFKEAGGDLNRYLSLINEYNNTLNASYVYANQQAERMLNNLKQQEEIAQQAYLQASANEKWQKTQENNAADEIYKKLKEDPEGKGLWKYQYQQLQNREMITGLDQINDQKMRSLVEAYNIQVQKTKITADALDEASDQFMEAQLALAQGMVETGQAMQDNIDAFYDAINGWKKSRADLEKARRETLKSQGVFGTSKTGSKKEDGVTYYQVKNSKGQNQWVQQDEAYRWEMNTYYWDQIKELEGVQANLLSQAAQKKEALDKALEQNLIRTGTEEYYAIKQGIEEAYIEARNLDNEIRDLKDELRQEIEFAPFDKALEQAEGLRDVFSDVQSMITDEMKFDENGRFTNFGLTNMALDVQQYESSLMSIQTLMKKRDEIINQYNKNNTEYSKEEFEADLKETQDALLDMLKNSDQARRAVISDVLEQAQAELDVTNKIIEAEKKRFTQQKDMLSYDRNLKDKNKEVQLLEAQYRALTNVTNAEDKAQQARIKAQLEQAREERDQMVEDHVYEMRIEGLDQLQQDLQERMDEYSKELNGNLQSLIEALNNAIAVVDDTTNLQDNTISSLLKSFGWVVDENMKGGGIGLGVTNVIAGIPKMGTYDKNTTYREIDDTIVPLTGSSQAWYNQLLAGSTSGALVSGKGLGLDYGSDYVADLNDNIKVMIQGIQDSTGVAQDMYGQNFYFTIEGNLDNVTLDDVVAEIRRQFPYISAYTVQQISNTQIKNGTKPKYR